MTPSRELRLVRDRTLKSLDRLRTIAATASLNLPDRAAKLQLSHAAIEVLNTWANFSRAYLLSCILRPRRVNGGRVTTNGIATTFNEVVGVAVIRHKPHLKHLGLAHTWHRRDEPPWHDPNILISACDDLGCSNNADIKAALSLPTRALIDLPVFRNFFAHRNRLTATAAKDVAPRYVIPSNIHPIEILARKPKGRPYPLLVDWIDDIVATVGLLCD
jgi:hypothetical protein